MSEKRFAYHEEYFPFNVREIIDNENGEAYDCEDATDVLNELFDENEQLKKENEVLKKQKSILDKFLYVRECERDRLKEKNEQLKKEYKIAIDEMVTDYKKLEKENEQLKKKLESLQKVLHLVECVSDE